MHLVLLVLLFAYDFALTAHTGEALQWLISCFTRAYREFGLTQKTKIIGQDISSIPSISIGDYTLEVVEDFTYLGSTISSNLSPLMLNWTHRLARQWQQWLALLRGSGKSPCWPPTPWWRCIKPVCSACCLWQWGMDSLLHPRTQTQCFQPVLPQKDFRHHLAGPCPKQEHPGSGKNTKHVCFACPKVPVVAWSHESHAGWTNPQGHTIWWACHWLQTCRKASSSLERHL